MYLSNDANKKKYELFFKRIIIICFLFLILPKTMVLLWGILSSMPGDMKTFYNSNSNDLLVSNYGACNKLGFGYLDEIVRSIPEADVFPVVRYGDWYKSPEVLFNDGRIIIDERILVGINLDERDIREVKITDAVLSSIDETQSISTWLFHTDFDYDLLTGFSFQLCEESTLDEEKYSVTLYDSDKNYEEMGQWIFTFRNSENGFGAVHLDEPIKKFSFSRGVTDFILELGNINPDNSIKNICRVEVLGVKVDISDYTVFHTGGNKKICFAAVKNSFYEEIQNDELTEWQDYLRDVSNVDFSE